MVRFEALDSIGGTGLGRLLLNTEALAASGQLTPEQVAGIALLLNTTWTDPWVGGVGSFIGPVAGAGVIGTLSAALPWIMAPVVADILVFVLAIVFIKFRPQGLLAGKGV